MEIKRTMKKKHEMSSKINFEAAPKEAPNVFSER